MITIENIIEWSKPHSLKGGRMTRIHNNEIEFSIVGGTSGLYGDFKDDFEVAVIDRKKGNFVTKFFKPESKDDVIPYMGKKDLEEFVNQMFQKGFQVN